MWRALARPVSGVPAWTILLLGASALLLVPWTVLLTTELPDHQVARHWDTAWAGFDIGLAAMLAATVVAALRRWAWLPALALAAATMLACDAWFDVVTSASGADFRVALAAALVIELPLALVCVFVACQAFAAPPGDSGRPQPRSRLRARKRTFAGRSARRRIR